MINNASSMVQSDRSVWTKYLTDPDWHESLDSDKLRILRDHVGRTINELNHLKKKLPVVAVYRTLTFRHNGLDIALLVRMLEEVYKSIEINWRKKTGSLKDVSSCKSVVAISKQHGTTEIKPVLYQDEGEEMIVYGYGANYPYQRHEPSKLKYPLLNRGRNE